MDELLRAVPVKVPVASTTSFILPAVPFDGNGQVTSWDDPSVVTSTANDRIREAHVRAELAPPNAGHKIGQSDARWWEQCGLTSKARW